MVYAPTIAVARLASRLGDCAEVVDVVGASTVELAGLLADLHGAGRPPAHGRGRAARAQPGCWPAGLADELQLVVAPVFVGDPRAPRFVDPGAYPFTAPRRARLAEVRRVGDAALLRYALTDRCPSPDQEC